MSLQESPTGAESSLRFVPAKVRDLTVPGHVVLLICLLVNVYAGFHFYSPLLDDEWGDFDDDTWRRDTASRNTFATIFDPLLTTGHEAMDTSYLPVQSLLYHVSVNVLHQGGIPIRVFGLWLHVLNSCLVLLLALRFCRSVPAAHMASLMFLLFPRNAGAVGWLCASLAHGLVLSLYLMAFLLLQTYLHRRGWWRLAFGVVLFIIAVLTKELGSTLFAAVVLYDVLVSTGLRELWPPRLKVWLALVARHTPMALVVIAAVAVQMLKYETGFVNTKFGGVAFGWRNPLRLLELLTLTLHWGEGWPRESVYAAMAGILAVMLAGVWVFRRKPALLFLLLWVPLVVTPFTISNFRDVHRLGRYVYEASAIMAVLGASLSMWLVRWRRYLAWPVLNVAVFMLVVFAITVTRIAR